MTHFYRFHWNAICHSPTLSRDILNVTTVPLRWPSSLPSITATSMRLKSPELNRTILQILDHSRLWVMWHIKRKTSEVLLIFCVFPHLVLEKTERKSCFSFADLLYMHWHGNQGLSALWAHRSSYPFAIWWLSIRTSNVVLIVLMKMCHSDMSHVRHRVARRQGEATGWCCVVLCCKWLMTLSVVVLWLRLQWFIATAHNVIRLNVYTEQNSVVYVAIWSQYVCVCLCTLHYIVMVCI